MEKEDGGRIETDNKALQASADGGVPLRRPPAWNVPARTQSHSLLPRTEQFNPDAVNIFGRAGRQEKGEDEAAGHRHLVATPDGAHYEKNG